MGSCPRCRNVPIFKGELSWSRMSIIPSEVKIVLVWYCPGGELSGWELSIFLGNCPVGSCPDMSEG